MPDITFLLPHWIYWGGILAVPAYMMFWSRRVGRCDFVPGRSTFVAYFLWATGGFMGLHRLYLRSWGAAAFIALFVGVIYCNHQAREFRNAHSIAKNESFNVVHDLQAAADEGEAENKIAKLRREAEAKTAAEKNLAARLARWRQGAEALALAIFIMLLLDAALIRRMTRRADAAGGTRPARRRICRAI